MVRWSRRLPALRGAMATATAFMVSSELLRFWMTFWRMVTRAPRIAMSGVLDMAMKPFFTTLIGPCMFPMEPPMRVKASTKPLA